MRETPSRGAWQLAFLGALGRPARGTCGYPAGYPSTGVPFVRVPLSGSHPANGSRCPAGSARATMKRPGVAPFPPGTPASGRTRGARSTHGSSPRCLPRMRSCVRRAPQRDLHRFRRELDPSCIEPVADPASQLVLRCAGSRSARRSYMRGQGLRPGRNTAWLPSTTKIDSSERGRSNQITACRSLVPCRRGR